MAWRVEEADVRAIIDTDENASIVPFIDTANALTDYLSSEDSSGVLTAALLTQIEKYLAAHFYEHLDSQLAEEKTGDATGKYQGMDKVDCCKWWEAAVTLDVTGLLSAMKKGRGKLGISWLGLPPSEQTDYVDRD